MAENAATELIEEHAVIVKVIAALKRQAFFLSLGKEVPYKQMKESLELLADFADACHHAKEEKALFPALAGLPRYKAKADEFLDEHMRSREYMKAMRAALPVVTYGSDSSMRVFVGNANAYCALLIEHIKKENALFAKCGEIFSEEENKKMGRAFAKIEKEEIGEEKHEQYQERAEKLSEKAAEL